MSLRVGVSPIFTPYYSLIHCYYGFYITLFVALVVYSSSLFSPLLLNSAAEKLEKFFDKEFYDYTSARSSCGVLNLRLYRFRKSSSLLQDIYWCNNNTIL
jgi:hypothetical protein